MCKAELGCICAMLPNVGSRDCSSGTAQPLGQNTCFSVNFIFSFQFPQSLLATFPKYFTLLILSAFCNSRKHVLCFAFLFVYMPPWLDSWITIGSWSLFHNTLHLVDSCLRTMFRLQLSKFIKPSSTIHTNSVMAHASFLYLVWFLCTPQKVELLFASEYNALYSAPKHQWSVFFFTILFACSNTESLFLVHSLFSGIKSI